MHKNVKKDTECRDVTAPLTRRYIRNKKKFENDMRETLDIWNL